MRMGELFAQSPFSADPTCTLTWRCVNRRPDGSFLLHIRLPKMGTKEGEFVDVFPHPGAPTCPVATLSKQLKRQRETGFGNPDDPVFMYPSGQFLTTRSMNEALGI